MSIMNNQMQNWFDRKKKNIYRNIADKSIQTCENTLDSCFFWGVYEIEIPLAVLQEKNNF